LTSGGKRVDFGINADIEVANAGIVCRSDSHSMKYDVSANPHFAQNRRLFGLFKLQPHKCFNISKRRENANRRMYFQILSQNR
ncbi:hypothetical protein ACTHSM_11750, partial [Neisseria sp. P0009.S001]|uniref:hypothetical protein n=1 Tax=Neisseria sp. P0009.S001 TaxID=3436708 RepID=UPI003F7FCB84